MAVSTPEGQASESAACVTAGVTIGAEQKERDATGRGRAGRGGRAGRAERMRKITDFTRARDRFQDHRHRPLGHPSAAKISPESAQFGRPRFSHQNAIEKWMTANRRGLGWALVGDLRRPTPESGDTETT